MVECGGVRFGESKECTSSGKEKPNELDERKGTWMRKCLEQRGAMANAQLKTTATAVSYSWWSTLQSCRQEYIDLVTDAQRTYTNVTS